MKLLTATLLTAMLLTLENARAVILMNDQAEVNNVTEPIGPLANSGWQFEGQWGGFLGTPIAPNFFISAAHIGRPLGTFNFRGVAYTIERSFPVPNTDLLVWKVIETFPDYAPLYIRRDEIGRPLVVIGRGTDRGGEVRLNGELRGWYWGAGSGVQRWGENVVNDVFPDKTAANMLLYATFDRTGLLNEAQLSAGDSGGAVFLNDNGIWKLGGINYAVDTGFYTNANGSGFFDGALLDAQGYYTRTSSGSYVIISGPNPVPTGFYATAISRQIAAIYSIINPTGDEDHDGIVNLFEYALNLDPLTPDVTGLPYISREGQTVNLTYTRAVSATDLNFTIEQSSDLLTWSIATTQDQTVSVIGNARVVKATVAASGADRLFLRLRVTRP